MPDHTKYIILLLYHAHIVLCVVDNHIHIIKYFSYMDKIEIKCLYVYVCVQHAFYSYVKWVEVKVKEPDSVIFGDTTANII